MIGDVVVTDALCTNPYRYSGPYSYGETRVTALRLFRDGGDTRGLRLWAAPSCGGARQIDRDEVD